MDSLMLEGVTQDGMIWDTKKRAYQIDNKTVQFTVKYENIPLRQREAVRRSLKEMPAFANKEPTKEDIMKAFNQKVVQEGLLKK